MGILDYIKSKINKDKYVVNTNTFQKYDDVKPQNAIQNINGIHNKEFLRADSKIFEPLFDELRNNPDSSYDTYLNDLIRENIEYTPSRVSVMKKSTTDSIGSEDGWQREILSSRIANFMGVPTVYNCTVDGLPKGTILSVDYVRADEKLLDLSGTLDLIRPEGVDDDYVDILLGRADISNMVHFFNNALDYYKNFYTVDRKKLVNDFVREFITRVNVLGDNDFGFHNFDLSSDQNGNIRMLPMFDYEATFVNPNKKSLLHNVAYIKKYLKDFDIDGYNQRFKELVEPANFKKLTSGLKPEFVKEAYAFLQKQQSDFYSYAKYLKPENIHDLV